MDTIKNSEKINTSLFCGKASHPTITSMVESGMLPGTIENIDAFKRTWRQTFTGSFLIRYPKYYGIVERIRQVIGRLPEWEDFNRQNIRDIVELLKTECCKSSARTYAAMIRSVLNYNKEMANLPCKDFENELRIKNEPHVAIFLTMEELKRLEGYKPDNEREKVVLAQFLVSCYTGARHSDVLNMSDDNVQGKYLSYVSRKTLTPTRVEVKKGLVALINVAITREYSEATFNETIRHICRKSGIDERVKVFKAGKNFTGKKYEFVSSHTARRSFASNLAALGVPIREIQLRMGHASASMTERYILAPVEQLPEAAKAFFK